MARGPPEGGARARGRRTITAWIAQARTGVTSASHDFRQPCAGSREGMPARSIWNGTIAFGSVRVPIKLHSATQSKTVRFKEVHEKDGARIEHRRFCSKEN
jgi:hypothetical protein